VGGEALGLDVVETWAPGRKLFNSCWVELSVSQNAWDLMISWGYNVGPPVDSVQLVNITPISL